MKCAPENRVSHPVCVATNVSQPLVTHTLRLSASPTLATTAASTSSGNKSDSSN